MSVTPSAFRDALRHFPAGVTIVTLAAGGRTHGLTVSAFCSVSPDPPLVAVVIDCRHTAHRLLAEPGAAFAVNILAADQQHLSDRFAWMRDEDRFSAGRWEEAVTGAPILADALAWLDCRLVARHPAGDHTIFLGSVEASGVPRAGAPPLVYWDRRYRHLGPEVDPTDDEG